MIPAIYKKLCPGYELDLITHKPDERCVPERELGELIDLSEEFFSFFEKCTGFKLWEAQRCWAKRVLQKQSFAAIAPTGIGKTVFGIVMSLFHSSRGWGKSLILVPTVLLVKQVEERVVAYSKRGGVGLKVLAYGGVKSDKEREKLLEAIRKGDFDILIATSQFLARRFDVISNNEFSFIFVDDVDSLLKNSKNVDRILLMLGFPPSAIESALRGRDLEEIEPKGVVMLSSATAKPGKRAILFRRLLGFNIGILREGMLRNVEDIEVPTKKVEVLVKILKEMGNGALIYVPKLEMTDEILDALNSIGIKAEKVSGWKETSIQSFAFGKLDALIGAAKPYGVLVRGLDLPEKVRYAVFYGAPYFEFSLESLEKASSKSIGAFLSAISPLLGEESRLLSLKLRRGSFTEEDLLKAKSILRKVLSDEELLKKLSDVGDIVVEKRNGVRILLPDIRTYIQGSGRTSRLFPGGLSKGASFLMEEGPLLNAFMRRASVYEIDFKPIREVDLNSLRKEIDEDRKRIRESKETLSREFMPKTVLFVVESPNKAKTIANFFGRPGRRNIEGLPAYDFSTGNLLVTVVATGGHIVDLSTREGYHGVAIEDDLFVPIYCTIKRCLSCGYQFTDGETCPICNSSEIADSERVLRILRRLAFEKERVIIGTDPDVEGEKIAWDVASLIRPFSKEIFRAEFHEVTKSAIIRALSELKEISEDRVRAQIVRRIEDRWIGFELSQVLQKIFKRRNLSAGRAQTPTLGWIISRFKEHLERRDITIIEGNDFRLRVDGRLGKPGEVVASLRIVSESEAELPPPPPFTTDEMLRESNRILRLGASETMEIAQNLFETGLITYHRTDSRRVSEAGLRIARIYLGEKFRVRVWGKEGAHECIRPTKPMTVKDLVRYLREGILKPQVRLVKNHLRLYDLIFRRFMASMTEEARLRKQKVEIALEGGSASFERYVAVVKPGWTSIYPYTIRIEPPLKSGQISVLVKHKKVPKVPLYTQGEVIATMREKGIGRPSTYAVILQKLLMRNYVVERGGRLIPTKLGMMVYDFLVKKYPNLISESRTRLLEEKMSLVEEGLADYQQTIKEVYEEIRSAIGS